MTLRMQVAICCYLLYELWGLLGSGQRKMLRSWEPTFILFIMQIVVYKKQKLKTKTLSIIKISNSSLLIITWPDHNFTAFVNARLLKRFLFSGISLQALHHIKALYMTALWRSATRRWILLTYARQFLLWAYFTYLLWLWILCVGLF